MPGRTKAVVVGSTKRGARLRRWTNAEADILRAEYRMKSSFELAKKLGRTVSSVQSMAHKLGLTKCHARLVEMGRENVRRRPNWTKESRP